jgi:hypothetical protein
LTATTHAFPAATSGQQLEHDFINFQNVSVSACKLHDADGSLGTSGDQTPIEGWSIYLTVDGQRQGPAKETGANGCASWQDLGPGKSYGLEEELPPEWSPLTPIKKNFGTATSGAAYSYTFINTQASIGYSIYLPLLVK